MKFSEHLNTHLTPEWRIQYIHYKKLKQILQDAVDTAPASGSESTMLRHFASADEEFFRACSRELNKINNFFSEKLSEAKRRWGTLTFELEEFKQRLHVKSMRSFSNMVPNLPKNKINELRFTFCEFYLSLVLLQNYQTLNQTGFRKILKKHDKLFHQTDGLKWFKDVVEVAQFCTDKGLMNMINEVEDVFTDALEDGNRQNAMKRLRVPPLTLRKQPITSFRFGFFTGSLFIMVCCVFLSVHIKHLPAEAWIAGLLLFRGYFINIFHLALFGLNARGFRNAGVNHILIFELDPRDFLTSLDILEMASFLAVVGTFSLLLFVHADYLDVPRYSIPLGMFLFIVLFMINPLPICRHSARFWLLKRMGRMVSAPYFPVEFADFWLADQMNSLTTVLLDYHYVIYFYLEIENWNTVPSPQDIGKNTLTRAIVSALPATWRLLQCLRRYWDTRHVHPYLTNAGKYFTTYPCVIFSTAAAVVADNYKTLYENPFMWLYMVAHIVNTIYVLIWDTIWDFGVLQISSGKNIFLRDHLVYSNKFYYFAIIENFLLRCLWMISFVLVLRNSSLITILIYETISGLLDCIRRFIWNYIRLENEHLNNVGQFRAVRDISIKPIDPDEPNLLERIMDGVYLSGRGGKRESERH